MRTRIVRSVSRHFRRGRLSAVLNVVGLAVGLAVAVALLTLSHHTLRAALADPVRVLRSE